MFDRGHTVLPAVHTRTIPFFTPQPQTITALWLVVTPTCGGLQDGQAEFTWVAGYYTEIGFLQRE